MVFVGIAAAKERLNYLFLSKIVKKLNIIFGA